MSTSCRRNYQTLIVRNSVVPNQCRPEPPLISVPGIDSDLVQRWMTGGGTPRRLIIPHSRLDAYSHQTRWYQSPSLDNAKVSCFWRKQVENKKHSASEIELKHFSAYSANWKFEDRHNKKMTKEHFIVIFDIWRILTDLKTETDLRLWPKKFQFFFVSVNYISKTETEPGIKLMGCIGSNKAKCHSTQIKSRISTIKCILTGLMY